MKKITFLIVALVMSTMSLMAAPGDTIWCVPRGEAAFLDRNSCVNFYCYPADMALPLDSGWIYGKNALVLPGGLGKITQVAQRINLNDGTYNDFINRSNYKISDVTVWFSKKAIGGSTTDNVIVELYNDQGGFPGGSALCVLPPKTITQIDTSEYGMKNVFLPISDVTLTDSLVWVVVTLPTDANNYIGIQHSAQNTSCTSFSANMNDCIFRAGNSFIKYSEINNGITRDMFMDITFIKKGVGVNETVSTVASTSVRPNPAIDECTISYNLSSANNVTVIVRDVTGKEVIIKNEDSKAAGSHTCCLNTSNIESGIYFYTIQAGNSKTTGKLVITK